MPVAPTSPPFADDELPASREIAISRPEISGGEDYQQRAHRRTGWPQDELRHGGAAIPAEQRSIRRASVGFGSLPRVQADPPPGSLHVARSAARVRQARARVGEEEGRRRRAAPG